MRRNRNLWLLAAALVFAALGQFYFFWRRQYVWDGIIFMTLAIACFVVVLRRSSARPAMVSWEELRPRLFSLSSATLGVALLLNFVAARAANTNPPPADYTAVVILWLSSLVLFCMPFFVFAASRQAVNRWTGQVRAALTTHRSEFYIVLAILLVGFVLRFWDLEHIPRNLSGDEGTQGLWAVDVLEGRLRNPFATGWFTVPTMSFFAQAFSLRLFGDSVAGLRSLSALTGTATLLFTYLLARRTLCEPAPSCSSSVHPQLGTEGGQRVALLALTVLAINHYHVHFSRLGSNQIADPLFMALTLWLLTEGLASGKRGWFLTAGLTMGLSWYGYFGSRVIMLVVAAYVGLRAVRERGFLSRHLGSLILMGMVALMAASPLLLYYVEHPENLSARFNQVNFMRWLENELARPEHPGTFELVVRQVWRSLSAFNHTLDPTFWYRAQIPLLDFISGIFFLFGLVAAVHQRRRPNVSLILIWFGLSIFIGWVLTENPPSSMRMVIVAPAVALLVALGLDRMLLLGRRILGGERTDWNSVGAALLILALVFNVYYYFVVYTPTRVYGNPSAETGTVMARYLDSRDDGYFVYFYGPPFIYYDFGTIRFIARDTPGLSVPPKDREPDYTPQLQETGTTLFIVLRERLEELAEVQQRFPNGKLTEFFSEVDGRLMFVVYQVPG
jgi:4-amino-4-deoxy-L-arabinose transferase-like glycosyltransferase